MSMLADKYEPLSLSEILHNKNARHFFHNMAHADVLPHIILRGYRGSGKKLLLRLFMKESMGKLILTIQP